MTYEAHDEIDDLFAQIRLRLSRLRESDPTTAEELKGLVTQLEDWVESLVVDSLKLKTLESRPKRATAPEKSHQERPSRKKKTAK